MLLDVLQTGRVNVTKAMTEAGAGTRTPTATTGSSRLTRRFRAESNRRQPDQARLTDLKALLEKARLEFGAFQTALYAAHPELKVQRGEATADPRASCALLPDAASALLEYVVTDEVTYLFVATRATG